MSNESPKLPTRPGWWWREGNHGPYIEEVDGDQNHAPFLAILGSNVVDDGTWLAPIPGPEVLAALAEYTAAVHARDDEGENRVRCIQEGGSNSADDLMELVEEMEYSAEMLADAIRADRDGAA